MDSGHQTTGTKNILGFNEPDLGEQANSAPIVTRAWPVPQKPFWITAYQADTDAEQVALLEAYHSVARCSALLSLGMPTLAPFRTPC